MKDEMTLLPRKMIWLLIVTLLVGTGLYFAKGLVWLFSERGGGDSHLRWQEQQYVIRGQNPYDITYAVLGVGRPPMDPSRDSTMDDNIGLPDSGGYPPWAFLFGYLMFWPPWPLTKVYFLAISFIMIAVSALWSYRAVSKIAGDRLAGCLAASAVLAISGYSTAIHVGQYGPVVAGILALSAWSLSKGQGILGGLLMAIALLKPTIGGPFVLILLVTGQWRGLAACVAYVGVASAFVWFQTKTPPWEMFLQSVSVSDGFVHDSQGLINVLISLGVTVRQVTPVLAVGIGLPGLAALYYLRRHSLLNLFALAAVIGRLWAYHKTYDNMMMQFLLVATAAAATSRNSPKAWFAFFLSLASLCLPASLYISDWIMFMQIAAWMFCLVVLFERSPAAGDDRKPTKVAEPVLANS
jgi:hypothetical protein